MKQERVCRPVYPGTETPVEPAANDATLLALHLSVPVALSPEFDSKVKDYSLRVPSLVQELVLVPVPTHPASLVKVNGVALEPGEHTPPLGLSLMGSTIEIEVTAPAGDILKYQIDVNRGSEAIQEAYVKSSHVGAEDQFGWSIAVSADVLAIGAPGEDRSITSQDGDQTNDDATDSGAVYIFRNTADGWLQETYLKPSKGGKDAKFGHSIALDGDLLAVGAPGEVGNTDMVDEGEANGAAKYSGAVYVFRWENGIWDEKAHLVVTDSLREHSFGWSVALADNMLAVGAYPKGINGIGAAYVFHNSMNNIWMREASLEAPDPGTGDGFGVSVALAGGRLAVGDHREDSSATGVNNGATDSGAVYVFRREETPAPAWKLEPYLKASNASAEDGFGTSVALAGELLAVGAPEEDSSATGVNGDEDNEDMPESGAVYVFRREGTTGGPQEAYLKASNPDVEDHFGASVALAGDLLAVGAPGEDSSATGVEGDQADNGAIDSGAVYIFRWTGSAWRQEIYLKATNTGAEDEFGTGLALTGDTLAVGAPQEDSSATGVGGKQGNDRMRNSGAVYVLP